MSQIKQLLQLNKQGMKLNTIARTLGISRNTVKSYLHKLSLQQIDIDMLLKLDDPILEVRFHAGNPAYLDGRFEYFQSRLAYYESELKRKHVTRRILWQEYRSEQPQGYGYTQFCYHLSQQLIARKPTMVLSHNPGEKLFVDFAGDKICYIDPQTGEIIYCPGKLKLPFLELPFFLVCGCFSWEHLQPGLPEVPAFQPTCLHMRCIHGRNCLEFSISQPQK